MHRRAGLPGVIRDRHTGLGGRSRNIRERVRAADTGEAPAPFLFAVLRWTRRDAVGFVVGAVAAIAIFVNALFMQSTPAPVMPKISHASRAPGEIITDIQHERARRGYYDGPVDGLYGPRTEGAIRDFERAASLKPSALPSEALLHAIMRSAVRRDARSFHPSFSWGWTSGSR